MKKSIQLLISLILFLFILVPNNNSQNLNNYAGVFNGTNSYLAVPSQAEVAPTTAITIEVWVYPTTGVLSAIVGKNFTTSYTLYMSAAGNIGFYPKGGGFFATVGTIPLNQWTHIAATYDGAKAKIYINGVCNDSTSAITGAIGTNTDSLFIGCDRYLGANTYFFPGKMDNIRIWNVARSAADIANNRFINLNLYNGTGKYVGLTASYSFDLNSNNTSVQDWSGVAYNNAVNHNVTLENDSNIPVPYQDFNNSLGLDGASYCSANNNAGFNATTAITVETWIRPDTINGVTNSTGNFISKSSATTADWYLDVNHASHGFFTPAFGINNSGHELWVQTYIIPANKWTHLAATYNSVTGLAILYVNGDSIASASFGAGVLINNTTSDSLFLGNNALYPANKFTGQIDEVRIWSNTVRTSAQIKGDMYNTYQASLPAGVVAYNFDILADRMIQQLSVTANLYYFNNAIIGSPHLQNVKYFSAPILFDPGSSFTSANYLINTRRQTIATVNSVTTDSIQVTTTGTISDIKLFALFNAIKTNRFTITLKSPNGTTCTVTPTLTANNLNDIMAVFDNTAANTISYATGGITAPFSPIIKPANSFAVFTGTQAQGYWKLSVTGDGATDVSYCLLSGWGIKPTIVTAVNDNAQLPTRFELAQNYPNPFNPSTTIRYTVANTSLVTLKVYDALGREVATLVNENKNAGTYSVEFNKPLASGVYIYKLQAGSYIESKKMILLK